MEQIQEEQLDYGEDDHGVPGVTLQQHIGSTRVIPSFTGDGMTVEEDDDYDDLYSDVNVGEGFLQAVKKQEQQQLLREHRGQLHNGPLKADNEKSSGNLLTSSAALDIRRDGEDTKSSNWSQESWQRNAARDSMSQGASDQRSLGGNGPSNSVVVKRLEKQPSMMPVESSGKAAAINSEPMQPNRMTAASSNSYQAMNESTRTRPELSYNNGLTVLYVGELHWWTTDEDLEIVLSQYGRVKEIKFFEERASGKSKGYCQVEFYESTAAAACKNRMDGHMFNGRPCVVAFASADSLKQMANGSSSRNAGQFQPQLQGRRQTNGSNDRGGVSMNHHGSDRPGWNRNSHGARPNRERAANGARSNAGVAGMVGAGGFGNTFGLTAFGAPSAGLMQPPSMMGAVLDPGLLSRGVYGSFPGAALPGILPSYQAVNPLGYPGVAPHLNPAFFPRGVPASGLVMFNSGIEGTGAGTWNAASTGSWNMEDPLRVKTESSYREDGASEYEQREADNETNARSNFSKEKDRVSGRDLSENSGRRYGDDREQSWEKPSREQHQEEHEMNRNSRQKDLNRDNNNVSDRDHHARSQTRSRTTREEEHKPHSRDVDYGKRRRMP